MKNHTVPTIQDTKPGSEPKSTELEKDVITDVSDFQMKAQAAALMGEEFLVVSEKVFNAIARGIKTPYLTYGNPGIKVYLSGTKQKCDEQDQRRLD